MYITPYQTFYTPTINSLVMIIYGQRLSLNSLQWKFEQVISILLNPLSD